MAAVETTSSTWAVRSVRRAATVWCPMGSDVQTGPTLSAYDHLLTDDGTTGVGLTEQGILRTLI